VTPVRWARAAFWVFLVAAGCGPHHDAAKHSARPKKNSRKAAGKFAELPRGPGIGRPGENPKPGSLASAVAEGKVPGSHLAPPSEYSSGPAEEIPRAPERRPARTLEEARARALADLGSPSAHTRFVAALEAGWLGLAEAVPELAEMVRREDAAAAAAVRSLGRLGGDEAAQALGSRLGRSRDAAFDLEIIRALGHTGSRFALRPLLRSLEDDRVFFRLAAAAALGELGMREAGPALARALERSEGVPALRVAIATALAKLGDPRGFDILDEAASRGSPDLQAAAISGLAVVAAGAGEDLERARLRARAHWKIGSVLGSPYPEAWRAAFSVLVRMHPAEADGVLAALEGASPEIALRARLARAAFGGHAWRDVVSSALVSADPHMRSAACEALEALGDRSGVELALRALEDPQPSVRVAAARALGRLGGETAAAALEKALSREDPALRAAAGEALASIRSRGAAVNRVAALPRAEGGYALEGVVRGAGGEHLCVIRSPDGKAMLLRKGEDAGGGYTVERIVAGDGERPKVVLARDGSTITLEAAVP